MAKTGLHLYSDFEQSDIIVASPLGLRLIIGVDGAENKQNFDFLSSIEVLVVDQVCVFFPGRLLDLTWIFFEFHSHRPFSDCCLIRVERVFPDAKLVAHPAPAGAHEQDPEAPARH